jgi:threonylcarbamoyladenosine tRNA methylthiotransferase MtaB
MDALGPDQIPSRSTPRASGPGTVAVAAVGCRANREEMECLLSRLGQAGYRVVPFGEPADWVVVNTCTVTAEGDADSRQMIRRGARGKNGGTLIVTGCLAQRDPAALASLEGVDWVVGNRDKAQIQEWVRSGEITGGARGQSRTRITVDADPTLVAFPDYGSSRAGRRARASLKIQDGCDEHCTYCIIPKVRGASRSRSLDDVLRQVGRLVRSGYREVVLTGINVACWGRDLPQPKELPDLLDALVRVPDLERVRLSSLEPQYLTPAWCDRMAENRLLCRHFHLPLQSGDDAILRRMGRNSTRAMYAELIRTIRSRMPDAAIGCDLMVGFPGETEEHFARTEAFLAGLPLAYLHVFSYSPRPDTPALRLGTAPAPLVRKERSRRLRALDRGLRSRFAQEQQGSIQTVLPERKAGEGHCQGLTGNYLRIRFPWPHPLPARGRLPLVRIEGVAREGLLEGRPVGPVGWSARPRVEGRE